MLSTHFCKNLERLNLISFFKNIIVCDTLDITILIPIRVNCVLNCIMTLAHINANAYDADVHDVSAHDVGVPDADAHDTDAQY